MAPPPSHSQATMVFNKQWVQGRALVEPLIARWRSNSSRLPSCYRPAAGHEALPIEFGPHLENVEMSRNAINAAITTQQIPADTRVTQGNW